MDRSGLFHHLGRCTEVAGPHHCARQNSWGCVIHNPHIYLWTPPEDPPLKRSKIHLFRVGAMPIPKTGWQICPN